MGDYILVLLGSKSQYLCQVCGEIIYFKFLAARRVMQVRCPKCSDMNV